MKKTVKKLFSVLLACVMLPAILPAFGAAADIASGTCGSDAQWNINQYGKLIIQGTGAMDDYAADDAPWAEYRAQIKGVAVNKNITHVGANAFAGYAEISWAYMANTVTSIGEGAFAGTSCRGIIVPSGVSRIEERTFAGCVSLHTVVITSSTVSIADRAFENCPALDEVFYSGSQAQWELMSVGENNEALGAADLVCDITRWGYADAFSGQNIMWTYCDDGTYTLFGAGGVPPCEVDFPLFDARIGKPVKKAVIKEGIENIPENLFSGASYLNEIIIPSTVREINQYAFFHCTGITSITVDPANPVYHSDGNCLIKTASKELVLGCVTSVIPADGSVTAIIKPAFTDCTGLTSITIPEGIVSIGMETFWRCTGLTSIEFPASLTSVHSYAFYGNDNLTQFTVAEGNPVYHSTDGCLIETASKTLTRGCKASVIPDDGSVTSIGFGAFYGTTVLEEISVPYGIVSIGDRAFSCCTKLSHVDLPGSLEVIGEYAFEVDRALTEITIPDSVNRIKKGAFCRCSGLTGITVPDSVTSLGTYAFEYCEALTSAVLPCGLTSIPNNLFTGCRKLASVNIPENVTVIGECAFDYSALTSVTFPDGLTEIKAMAFDGCYGLTSVILPESVTKISTRAFDYCTSLTDVWYKGTQEQWEQIDFGTKNAPLLEAEIHYGYHEHTPGEAVRENVFPATCTAGGSYEEVIYCVKCDYEFSRTHVTVAQTNHANQYTVAESEATASAHGYTAGVYCLDCDTWLSGHEVIHNHLGAQTVVKPATETEEGLVDIVCTVCGETIRYTASVTEPEPEEENGSVPGFWVRIQDFFRGFIDWFLRLFKRP